MPPQCLFGKLSAPRCCLVGACTACPLCLSLHIFPATQGLTLSAPLLSQVMPRRERGPPCTNPACTDKDSSSGQWAYLPPIFSEEHSFDKDDCHCHKRPCRRWCGKLGAPLPPGRAASSAKRVRAGDAAIGVAADELPRPPILVSIEEIWAVRYAFASFLLPPCMSLY